MKEFSFKAIVRYLIDNQVAEIKTYTVKGITFRSAKSKIDNLATEYIQLEGYTGYEIAVLRSGR